MAYTVAVRQGGVKRAEVGALLTHEYRKTLEHDGTKTQHDNENIDPTRSHLNRDYIFRNGELEPLVKVSDIHEELERRLENVGGTRTLKDGSVKRIGLRSDAKVLRNFIIQLDPEHTGTAEQWEQKPEVERQKDLSLMVDTLIKDHIGGLYGKENLLSMTLHMDEKSPHVHLMVTPIDSEGRIRNESFIKSKSAMRKFWDGARAKLRDAGYEVEMVTRDIDAKHETLRQFKTRTGKAKAEALELEEKARKQREELEREAREAKERLQADLEKQAQQARLNLANELATERAELKKAKEEKEKAKKSAEVWISTQENIQATIGTLEEERDELQAEKGTLTSENNKLKEEKKQWLAKNGNFLESWVKAQGMFGRPSEENRKMLAEALEARQRAEELHDKTEAKIKKAADLEQRTADYVVEQGEKRISKKVDEVLAQERQAVRSKEQKLSDKENSLTTRENAVTEKEKKLNLEASRVDAQVERLEGLKSFASVSLEDRDSVVALAGFLAHANHRADVDKHNKMVEHINNYSQVKPYETRLGADQIKGYLGEAMELYNRGSEENAYTKLKAQYHAPSQTQGYGYGR